MLVSLARAYSSGERYLYSQGLSITVPNTSQLDFDRDGFVKKVLFPLEF